MKYQHVFPSLKEIIESFDIFEVDEILCVFGIFVDLTLSSKKRQEQLWELANHQNFKISNPIVAVIHIFQFISQDVDYYYLATGQDLILMASSQGLPGGPLPSSLENLKTSIAKYIGIYSVCNKPIKIDRLPLFLERIIIVEPTIIYDQLIVPAGQPCKLCDFSFKLATGKNKKNRIKDLSSNSGENKVFLRLGLVNSQSFLFTDYYPGLTIISVNNHPISLFDFTLVKHENYSVYEPIEITTYLKSSKRAVNFVSVACVCDFELRLFYSVFIGRKRTNEDLVSSIPLIPLKDSLSILNKQLQSSGTTIIFEDDLLISLSCQVSLSRIKIPVRFSSCTHVQCCDANSYINLMQQSSTWVCSLCDTRGKYEDLGVDQLMKKIIDDTPLNVKKVSLSRNGKFKSIFEKSVADEK